MKTVISIKTESKIKEQADKAARQFGIPLSTIMHALLLQFIRDKKVSLDLSGDKSLLSTRGATLLEEALADKQEYEFNSPQDMVSAANKLK